MLSGSALSSHGVRGRSSPKSDVSPPAAAHSGHTGRSDADADGGSAPSGPSSSALRPVKFVSVASPSGGASSELAGGSPVGAAASGAVSAPPHAPRASSAPPTRPQPQHAQ